MGHSATQTPVRKIARRTRGLTHGPVTRLISPSDLGEILKPFVFLDLFDHKGAPFDGTSTRTRVSPPSPMSWKARSAISTQTTSVAPWPRAASNGWWRDAACGTAADSTSASRTRGFQLWIALPPELELGPTVGIYLTPEAVPVEGSTRVLLGSYGPPRVSSRLPRRSSIWPYA